MSGVKMLRILSTVCLVNIYMYRVSKYNGVAAGIGQVTPLTRPSSARAIANHQNVFYKFSF